MSLPRSARLQLSREEMKEIFREHDVDGDGVLSIAELTQAFSFLGNLLPFYKAHYGLAYADADGDGFITEDELDSLVDYAMKFQPKMRSSGHAKNGHAKNDHAKNDHAKNDHAIHDHGKSIV